MSRRSTTTSSDLSLAIELAKSLDPGLQCFLLGHSAGGVTSVSYTLDYQDRIDGLICESFAFRVFAPDFALTLIKGASHILPDLPALKLKMEDFSRDPAWVAELLADPYTKDEAQPVETVAALVRAGDRMEREFGTITLPLLILHGTADKATRPDGSQEFYDHAGTADKQLILYEDYYHDLLNDLGSRAGHGRHSRLARGRAAAPGGAGRSGDAGGGLTPPALPASSGSSLPSQPYCVAVDRRHADQVELDRPAARRPADHRAAGRDVLGRALLVGAPQREAPNTAARGPIRPRPSCR